MILHADTNNLSDFAASRTLQNCLTLSSKMTLFHCLPLFSLLIAWQREIAQQLASRQVGCVRLLDIVKQIALISQSFWKTRFLGTPIRHRLLSNWLCQAIVDQLSNCLTLSSKIAWQRPQLLSNIAWLSSNCLTLSSNIAWLSSNFAWQKILVKQLNCLTRLPGGGGAI